jgi:ribosomal protein RSM22 (predicted rRNA methylase)
MPEKNDGANSLFINMALSHFEDETKLLQSLKNLQKCFITRQGIDDYTDSEDLVWAYTALYLPTNFVKLKSMFMHIASELPNQLDEFNFVDIGSGPGTYTWAWLDYHYQWQEKQYQLKGVDIKSQLFLIEKSTLMLEQANKIRNKLKISGEKIKMVQNYKEIISKKLDPNKTILFFGNSLNEMPIDSAFKLIKEFNYPHVMFMEPGTKESFNKVMQIRKLLFKESYECVYPCPGAIIECPMDIDNWCHQYVHSTHSQDLERLCQKLKMDRRSMPVVFHYYQKSILKTPSSTIKRIVRFIKETKFSFDYIVCKLNANKQAILERDQEIKKTLKKSGIKKRDYKKRLGDKLF